MIRTHFDWLLLAEYEAGTDLSDVARDVALVESLAIRDRKSVV